MKKIVLLTLAAFLSLSAVAQADKCRTFPDRTLPVKAKVCTTKDGSSTYYQVEHKSKIPADICWQLMLRNNSWLEGCQADMVRKVFAKADCPNCGVKGKGVLFFHVKTYAKDELPGKGKKADKAARADATAPVAAAPAPATAAPAATAPATAPAATAPVAADDDHAAHHAAPAAP